MIQTDKRIAEEAVLERPAAQLSRVRSGEGFAPRALKRAFDLAIAVPACLLLLPLLAIVAVAVKLDSPGPVLFRQKRRGLEFEPFTIMKFRSLRHAAPDP